MAIRRRWRHHCSWYSPKMDPIFVVMNAFENALKPIIWLWTRKLWLMRALKICAHHSNPQGRMGIGAL